MNNYKNDGEATANPRQDGGNDSREKLAAEASELVAEYAASGDVCDALYHGMLELLDRQAAITERETLHSRPMCAGSDTCPALNRLVGKHVERETPETSDDSREKLEADIQNESFSYFHTPYGLRKVRGWLDRQAAMVERYWREQVDALVVKGDKLAEANAELERELEAARAKNRSLKAHIGKMQNSRHVWHERAEALQAKLDALEAHGVTVSEPFCGGYEVYNQFACDWRERAEALEAERDELTAANDKWLAKLGELQAELADCEREREKYRARLGEAARLCLQAAALADWGR